MGKTHASISAIVLFIVSAGNVGSGVISDPFTCAGVCC